MRKRLTAVLLGVSFMTWMAGCAQPPTAAVEAAKGRLEAVAAEGAIYASAQYGTAQDLVAQLDAELETQAGGFAPFRSYDRVGELVASVETAAGEVQQAIDAEKNSDCAREPARWPQTPRSRSQMHGKSLEGVPEDDASTFESDLASVETSLGTVDTLLADGQLTEAHGEAETALQTVTRVNASISELQATMQEVQEAAVERAARGGVNIPRAVLADGKPLAAGAYQVRLTDEEGPWLEFGQGTVRWLAVALPSPSRTPRSETWPRAHRRVTRQESHS